MNLHRNSLDFSDFVKLKHEFHHDLDWISHDIYEVPIVFFCRMRKQSNLHHFGFSLFRSYSFICTKNL